MDVDECENSPCEFDCINTEGSFSCSCPSPLILSADGYSCINVNELIDPCATDNGGCSHNCAVHFSTRSNNFYVVCSCPLGMFIDTDSKTCQLLSLPAIEEPRSIFVVESCPRNTYGPACEYSCQIDCVHGKCAKESNICKCDPGFTGQHCNDPCQNNTYGKDCQKSCPVCLRIHPGFSPNDSISDTKISDLISSRGYQKSDFQI